MKKERAEVFRTLNQYKGVSQEHRIKICERKSDGVDRSTGAESDGARSTTDGNGKQNFNTKTE